MLQIDDTIISLDIIEKKFICDLQKCHGTCCVEGDSGAPLEEEELEEIEKALPEIWEDLLDTSKNNIKKNGTSYVDIEGDLVTTINNGKECVFTLFEEDGSCKCAFEKAYFEKRISFRKPISCHLYPVRVKQYSEFKGVNYDTWEICETARLFGETKGIPLYVYLKEPLTRKFGDDWYKQLAYAAENLEITK